MFDLEDSLELNSIDYFDVQNLSFDHPLSCEELENFRLTIFNINNLSNIYFKENIDVDSIEKIKNLLMLSGFIDDKNIEKIVTSNFSREELRKFLSLSFENPDTWKVSYFNDRNNYLISDIPSVRKLYSYMDNINIQMNKKNLTNFEKIMYIYDIVKLYTVSDKNDVNLPMIVQDNIVNAKEINTLFSYLLEEFGIKSFVGKIKSDDNKNSYVTLTYVSDDKYNLNGLYLFAPSFDNLPKDEYKNDEVRLINYNYFGLKVEDIDYSLFSDTLTGVLSFFSNSNYDYCIQKVKLIKDKKINNDLKVFLQTFDDNFESIYNKIWNVRNITFDDIEKARSFIYKENNKSMDYEKIVKDNYFLRKEELFRPKTNDILEKILN